jgi:hypothetical protein
MTASVPASDPTDQTHVVSLSLPDIEQPFLGRWHQLVSTTNWEKGRIIQEWREALIVAGAPATDYADEAWSQRVGGVTSQHVGRLRRVFQRFGPTYDRFGGLYWSHFQAAMDWDDAEMWLEGAVQNSWSVSIMRRTRGETLGLVQADQPREAEVSATDVDDDFDPLTDDVRSGPNERVHYDDDGMPIPEGPDFGDDEETATSSHGTVSDGENDREVVQHVRPFENLQELPPDLADAFDAFKLAILRHKAEGWLQIRCDDVLASLDALKELALAPSADQSI